MIVGSMFLACRIMFIYHCTIAETKENMIFVETQHGGHLGFFEGNLLVPEAITWLDRVVVQYADAIVATLSKTK